MKVKLHYSGIAISYQERGSSSKNLTPSPILSKSKSNRDKRKVQDICYWLLKNSKYRPLIGVNTLPVSVGVGSKYSETFISESLSRFWENLRKNYDVQNYVWVREYQPESGRTHFHWVADSPYFDIVKVSKYWSGLFGSDAVNSIRLGTNPKFPPRKFFLDSPKMARYLGKYLGKGLQDSSSNLKMFNHSHECERKSRPVVYDVRYKTEKTGRTFRTEAFTEVTTRYPLYQAIGGHIVYKEETGPGYGPVEIQEETIAREFTLCENSENELVEVYGHVPDHLRVFDDKAFSWICPNPIHRVYYGVPKRKK